MLLVRRGARPPLSRLFRRGLPGGPVVERTADGDALLGAHGLGALGAVLGQGRQLLVHEEHDADVGRHVQEVGRHALVEASQALEPVTTAGNGTTVVQAIRVRGIPQGNTQRHSIRNKPHPIKTLFVWMLALMATTAALPALYRDNTAALLIDCRV